MEYNSKEVIPQEEKMAETSKQSELCIGCDNVTLPNNIITGATIEVTHFMKLLTFNSAQIVINTLDTRYVATKYGQLTQNLYVCVHVAITICIAIFKTI